MAPLWVVYPWACKLQPTVKNILRKSLSGGLKVVIRKTLSAKHIYSDSKR
jgi:hypothetical protein